MGLFNKLFNRKKVQPEDHYAITITDEFVKVEHPKWGTETLIWTDLQKVFYINADEGPWLPDLWLTLVGNNSSCRIPLGAKGFEEVYNAVSKFPGFDFDNAVKVISCTVNAEFLLWTK